MAFSKELEEVIEATLADGVITEKERAVLHKKALLEGVDPDEVDVMIEGRLQQMRKIVDDAKQKVRKCPSCGEIIPAMSAVCPSCGQVVDTSNADNKALAIYLEKLESALITLKEKGVSKYNNKVKAELEGMIRQGKSLYGDNKKMNYLISEVEASILKFDKSYRSHQIIKIAIIAIVGITALTLVTIRHNNVTKSKAQLIAKGEAQRDSLCALIDALPLPDLNNYKQCERELISITWKDIPTSGLLIYDKVNNVNKEPYLSKKRAYANQIYSVYKEIYPNEASRYAPEEISWASLNIDN